MRLITLQEAAERIETEPEVITDWVQRGLLSAHPCLSPLQLPPGTPEMRPVGQCVDEDELFSVAESMGWWQLSQEHWDDEED